MDKTQMNQFEGMLRDRSGDFTVTSLNGFSYPDDKAWHRHLKKLGVRIVDEDELCDAYNNHTPDTVLLKDPVGRSRSYGGMTDHGIDCWLIVPKELVLKCFVLGHFPPQKAKKAKVP